MRNSRKARDSSWRTRSRVIPSPTPTSSKVRAVSPSSPKRSASTRRMRGFRCDSAFASSFARSLVDVLSSGVSQLTVLDLIAVHVPRRRRREARGSVCWYTRGARRITDCRAGTHPRCRSLAEPRHAPRSSALSLLLVSPVKARGLIFAALATSVGERLSDSPVAQGRRLTEVTNGLICSGTEF